MTNQPKRLRFRDAEDASRALVAAAANGRPWDITLANGCLPTGWRLAGCDVAEFLPLTLSRASRAFRLFAVPVR